MERSDTAGAAQPIAAAKDFGQARTDGGAPAHRAPALTLRRARARRSWCRSAIRCGLLERTACERRSPLSELVNAPRGRRLSLGQLARGACSCAAARASCRA